MLKLIPVLLLVGGLAFTSCTPKDADIKAAIEKSLKENTATANVMVMVNEGEATLSGEVPDEATRASLDEKVKAVKGVKSVQNNTTPPAPQPAAPVVITPDDPLSAAVTDATKDFPGITATVSDGVIMVAGEITAARWRVLKMSLDGLKPKRVDASGLTIK